jgi:hypothetical protein
VARPGEAVPGDGPAFAGDGREPERAPAATAMDKAKRASSTPGPQALRRGRSEVRRAPATSALVAALSTIAAMLCFAATLVAQTDFDRRLEAALYRETVAGDVAGASSLYYAILAEKSAPHAIAARALWQLGQCQEKLGQHSEAHASYARLVREFAGETLLAAQARAKLAHWSEAGPGPRNLHFDEGDPGKTPPGWFIPQVEKGSGSLAELRRKGCRDNGGCAVLIAPPTVSANEAVGNLMQSFRAKAYRGKTVRLRAWIRVDGTEAVDRAQMWLRVDRPNGRVGFLDDMDGRPVRSAEWTACEIVAEIDADAEFVVFGVKSFGRAHVWVGDVSFDVVPDEKVTAVRNYITRYHARLGDTVTSFRYSGPEAVATVRKTTAQGAFVLVEMARERWTHGEDGWELSQREPLSLTWETAPPDAETLRALVEDLKETAKPLSGLEPFRAASGCVAIHRTELTEGAAERVLAAAGIAQFVLSFADVIPGSPLARWLAEPHLIHGRPATLAKNCDTLVFIDMNPAARE